jgi:hypothetical protein
MLSPQRVHPRYHAETVIHAPEDVVASALSQKIILTEFVEHDDLIAINIRGAIHVTPSTSE